MPVSVSLPFHVDVEMVALVLMTELRLFACRTYRDAYRTTCAAEQTPEHRRMSLVGLCLYRC